MNGKKLRSRKLFLIMAFLLIDTDSISNSIVSLNFGGESQWTAADDSDISPPPTNATVWLLDEVTGQCLGATGFSECGDTNMWRWRKQRKGESLLEAAHFDSEIVRDEAVNEATKDCLTRTGMWYSSSYGQTTEKLSLSPCKTKIVKNRNTRKSKNPQRVREQRKMFSSNQVWRYDPSSGRLSSAGMYSKLFGDSCVHRDGTLRSCRFGHTPIRQVLISDFGFVVPVPGGGAAAPVVINNNNNKASDSATKEPMEAREVKDGSNDHEGNDGDDTRESGSEVEDTVIIDTAAAEGWRCPRTGINLPFNLNSYSFNASSSSSPEESSQQLLMGAGVYTKGYMGMNFNVYTIGWYMDAARALKDPAFGDFRDKPVEELQGSALFQELMTADRGYDRTLLAKMAMTVKKDVMIQGLLDDLLLQPQHKEIVKQVGMQYEGTEFVTGTEIMFQWRQAKPANGFIETFDVRIGNLQVQLRHPGLAADLMYQFFSDEPVSAHAKAGFVSMFPMLLSSVSGVSDGFLRERSSGSRGSGVASGVQTTTGQSSTSRRDGENAGKAGMRRRIRRLRRLIPAVLRGTVDGVIDSVVDVLMLREAWTAFSSRFNDDDQYFEDINNNNNNNDNNNMNNNNIQMIRKSGIDVEVENGSEAGIEGEGGEEKEAVHSYVFDTIYQVFKSRARNGPASWMMIRGGGVSSALSPEVVANVQHHHRWLQHVNNNVITRRPVIRGSSSSSLPSSMCCECPCNRNSESVSGSHSVLLSKRSSSSSGSSNPICNALRSAWLRLFPTKDRNNEKCYSVHQNNEYTDEDDEVDCSEDTAFCMSRKALLPSRDADDDEDEVDHIGSCGKEGASIQCRDSLSFSFSHRFNGISGSSTAGSRSTPRSLLGGRRRGARDGRISSSSDSSHSTSSTAVNNINRNICGGAETSNSEWNRRRSRRNPPPHWSREFFSEKRLLAAFILLYSVLMILMSMPPALIQKGARIMVNTKNRGIKELQTTLQRSLSQTSNLANALRRPASTDLKLLFKA